MEQPQIDQLVLVDHEAIVDSLMESLRLLNLDTGLGLPDNRVFEANMAACLLDFSVDHLHARQVVPELVLELLGVVVDVDFF